jgi:MYXO-CTERM domain-containing protein
MNEHSHRARRLFLVAGLATICAGPLGAQANTNTTSTAGATNTMMQDTTMRGQTDDGMDFPWGLLGLLGLAGLLGRRKVETVHHDTTRTARPGDPNYRV